MRKLFAEDMVKYVISDVMERLPEEMKFFNDFVDKGLLERLDNIVSNFSASTVSRL